MDSILSVIGYDLVIYMYSSIISPVQFQFEVSLTSQYNILATRATMATHGHLGPFDSAHEDCDLYVEHLQLYCTANEIEDAEKRRAILLGTCGASTY